MTLHEERFIATMLGLAVGDMLGMPVEGWKREQIQKYVGKITEPIEPVLVRGEDGNVITKDEFGPLKYFTKDLTRGQYTDDTILSKALAESLVEKSSFTIFDIAQRQAAEYSRRVRSDGTVLGGFGRTTSDAFRRLLTGISPLESGVIGGPGNAPAMKMAPLGLYMAAHDIHGAVCGSEYNEGLRWAELVGMITHLDPRSVVSGIVQAHAVYALLHDSSRVDFVESLVDVCSKYEKPVSEEYLLWRKGSLASRLEWIKEHQEATPEEAHHFLGSNSNVFCSYPFALFMFQRYWDSPLEGLIETVNWGGDCDTTGSIYGALAGAKEGMIFPKEWIDLLEGRGELELLGKRLYQMGKEVKSPYQAAALKK